MHNFANAMEVFKLLPKTNCRECGEATCLAFAGKVFTGGKGIASCPYVDKACYQHLTSDRNTVNPASLDAEAVLLDLKEKLAGLNLKERAEVIDCFYQQGNLTIPILGKPFTIDNKSNVTTDLHVNSWVLGSALNYIISCKGVPLSSNWVPLRELPSGGDWYRLFGQQCESVLKKTADSYPELFADLVEMFRGTQVDDQFQSDVAVILSPLPLVPMCICYWFPEDGMESSLNLFFDDTAEFNIGMDGLYTLGVGIALMLERLSLVHGGNGAGP